MSDLDPVSVKVGEFSADLKNILKLHTIINDKLEKVIDTLPVIKGIGDKANERLDEITDDETGILTIAAANANDWVQTKHKAKWLGAGLLGSGALGGTVLGSWLTKIANIMGGHAP